ncbi:MAG: maltotransferase domain-containing protein, partial [Candidatus Dormibacteria bacterium]
MLVSDVRRQRVVIEDVRPVVDGGEFAAKAVTNQPLEVRATVFADGHDELIALVRHGRPGRDGELGSTAQEVALDPLGNDAWAARLTPRRLGPYAFQVVGLPDQYGSWLRDLRLRHAAGQELAVEFEEGALIAERQAARGDVAAADRRALTALATALRAPDADSVRLRAAGRPPAVALMRRTADRSTATVGRAYPVWVDRELAGFSAWYEMFPRSEGARGGRGGTLAEAALRLPAIAEMGFDIVYLPPVHPIGSAHRKGRNNALEAKPGDPGSPWAIGSAEGGHTAIHPGLGSLDDFDAFVTEARRHGLEVALDYALQCSPDHPWVAEHPEWFRHRPDGSIRYAE